MFEDVLETKTLLMGFGYDSDAIHAPNEHYGVDNFLLGIETITHFHRHFSKLSAKE
jgi:acetylornithine deacetylase/succinyl-diaminopimelate desuccinylase-like protein